jgi:predicted ribosomally synthesized peptide with nif11-like leader
MNAELLIQKMKEDQEFAKKVLTYTNNELLRNESLAQIDRSTSVGGLVGRMLEDKDFAEQFLRETEVEEAVKVAAQAGLSITEEDIQEANQILGRGTSAFLRNTGGELSEEDLENVAGGTLLTSIGELMITLISSVVATVSTIVVSTVVSVSTIVAANEQLNE